MNGVTLSSDRPVNHLEVQPSSWLFLNHLRGQQDVVAHDHNFLEIAFILHGNARHFVVDGEERSSAGDIHIIPPGAWHGYCDCRHFEVFNCLLSPVLMEKELGWMKDDPSFGQLLGISSPRGFAPVQKLRASPRRLKTLHPLLADLERAYTGKRSRTALLARLLLIFDFLQTLVQTKDRPVVKPLEMHPSIRQALDLIHSGIAEDWTLDRLAAQLRLNPSYLVRLFRTETGSSPMKFLSRIRAERAATLLLSGSTRIGDIGVAVGWPEPKQFATSFQRHFGVSASSYRRKMTRSLGETAPNRAF
ncbi:AraC family transcriptional regulator [Terrimicrobium sacchariphilum]|uniref:AraC family transcriptional regulator n=1 Tax=Terrimicrobium sacchariphilum TaxID=690879 RepID=A0A146G7Z7_TERSA|nr:AraC family transcriptional regulator [Terrimicrobium sacchariphilum]GAT33034.1 AraC family transcriptional regulator [Terrimicrobium sacchariphilum]